MNADPCRLPVAAPSLTAAEPALMSGSLTALAPAKVNLFLEVTGKRSDGYHELCTLFLKIALYDTVSVAPRRQGIRVRCDDARLPGDESNIVYQAAQALSRHTGFSGGAEIRLCKRIPVAAGLGGGSSDAATTLLLLNTLWRTRVSAAELIALGARLGADVPFFLQPNALAVGSGRGDRIKPLRMCRRYWLLLIKPPVDVSTAKVYAGLRLPLTNRNANAKLLIYALANRKLPLLRRFLFNRLESVTFRQHRRLRIIKQQVLKQGAAAALMSGSGSTMFGIFAEQRQAMSAAIGLRRFGAIMIVHSLP